MIVCFSKTIEQIYHDLNTPDILNRILLISEIVDIYREIIA